jgi:signal transduction histidine kinase
MPSESELEAERNRVVAAKLEAERNRVLAAELEAERNRVVAAELEAERNRVVVQLAGAVAHTLKQPLAVAWGYLELLLDDPTSSASLDQSTRRYLAEIQSALRTMDETINKLQQAAVHHTRPYAGSQEILDLDPPQRVA